MKRVLLISFLFFCFVLPRMQAAKGLNPSPSFHSFKVCSSSASSHVEGRLTPWTPGGYVPLKVDSLPEKKVKTEKVEGFWSVMGYFGSKLTTELGQRLNLVEPEEESEPVEVQLKIGSFELTRSEKRKKNT